MSIVRIYCMAHKKYEKLNNDIYIPLQVGAALHNSLGYHSDNTGDNISERNIITCIITMIIQVIIFRKEILITVSLQGCIGYIRMIRIVI